MTDRDRLLAELRRSGLSREDAAELADAYLAGRLKKSNVNGAPPVRCDICGFERIHVYPADEPESVMAVCLHCGAHYHALSGWIDPEAL